MTAKVLARPWSDICKGHNCERKDECRRYMFYLLATAGDRPFEHPCDNRCTGHSPHSPHKAALIKLDDTTWTLAPSWWGFR